MSKPAKWWLLTIPQYMFTPYLPPGCVYMKGQLEIGEGGFVHWQVFVTFGKAVRLSALRKIFGDVHCEVAKSQAARDYVGKEETRVEGTQFELGQEPIRRNNRNDWEKIKSDAIAGNLADIPGSVFVHCYGNLKKIAVDHMTPVGVEKVVNVLYGPTGTGKSYRAWQEAGLEAYPKNPRSIFWDGYRGQECVVIDEFRGGIDIAHMLRWLDRYPVIVDIKGSSCPLACKKIWITSNLHPKDWYPGLDEETQKALLRRLNIIHVPMRLMSLEGSTL